MSPRVRTVLRRIGLAALVLAGVCVTKAAVLDAPAFDRGDPPAVPNVDRDVVATHLAGALAFPTVSIASGGEPAAFDRLHAYLRATYPRMHAALAVEAMGPSRIYRWAGRDRDAPPILLLAHLDVVPVEPGTEADWTAPPFAGSIADGFLWGRGAMDDKASVIGICEAIEALLAAGFVPRRTIVLAFGHDEEVGGDQGAAAIAQHLHAKGDRFAFVLDEGGAVFEGGLPGLQRPVAFVGIAEKGYASVELTITLDGGHSSMPPKHGAIGRLAAAVAALEQHPMPLALRDPTRSMLDTLAPHLRFGPRIVMANLWLFDPIVARVLASQPAAAATVRTTTAPTIFAAGTADNVLAANARAVVNFRILPGDTIDDVLTHVADVIDDPAIAIRCLACREASAVSPVDGEGFATVRRAIEHVFPDAIVTPHLVIGGTDARHYEAVSDAIYRFLPMRMTDDDRKRLHGTDERIGLAALDDVVRFYATLITLAAG